MESLGSILGNTINVSLGSGIFATAGYLGARVCGMSAAASVGGMFTMLGVTFVGGLALTVPLLVIKDTLTHYELYSDSLEDILHMAFIVGSAAVGAGLFGLAIKPFVVCALMALLMFGLIIAIFTSAKAPSEESFHNIKHTDNIDDLTNDDSTFEHDRTYAP